MTRDARDLLYDYVDGSLTASECAEVERALERDAELRQELADLRRLLAEAQELPEQVPARDLWPGIERGIHRRRVVPLRFVVPVLAAAAALALFFAISPEPKGPGEEGIRVTGVPSDSLEIEFAQSSRDVLAALAREGSSLDPETTAIIEKNLHEIDQAMNEIRDALERDPNNSGLHRILTAENRRRHQVLQKAAALTSAI